MRILSMIIFVCFPLVFMVGCQRNRSGDMENTNGGNIRFLFDWDGYKEIPPGMNLIFYPIIDEKSSESDYMGAAIEYQLQYDGGDVSLPVGRYNVLIYNDYTYNIRYKGMDGFSTAEGYLDDYDLQPLASRVIGSHNVTEPDLFYVTQLKDLVVTSQDEDRVIVVLPKLKTLILYIHVAVKGVHNVSMVDGGISGIAGSIMLATGTSPDESPVNCLFPMTITEEGFYTERRVFLLSSSLTASYILELAFLLRDNSISMGKYKYDISDQIIMALQDNGGEIPPEGIHIYVDNVVVEDVNASGGGFDATVDTWGDEVNIELK